MQVTKESLQALLLRKDEKGMRAVGRALLVLRRNQTESEKWSKETKLHNGVGFTPSDAFLGTDMANFFERRGYLTAKQLAYWQEPAKTPAARIRITKYWKQLLKAAQEKQAKDDITQNESCNDAPRLL